MYLEHQICIFEWFLVDLIDTKLLNGSKAAFTFDKEVPYKGVIHIGQYDII